MLCVHSRGAYVCLWLVSVSMMMIVSATIVRSYRLCEEKQVIALLGTRYSDDSKQIAYVSQAFSVPQISYGSSSSDFSVKSTFPWFSRVYPDVGKEVQQMAGILVHERWMKVAIIYTADATGNAMFSTLNKVAKRRGIRILTSTVINDVAATVNDLAVQMDVIVNSGARIVLDLTNYQSIKVPLLQASVKAGLREPGYQWIGNHAASNLQEMRYLNGTAIPGMEESALGALILMPSSPSARPQFHALKQKILDLPITPNMTAMQNCPYTKLTGFTGANQGFPGLVYDSVKLLALALHHMIEVLQLDPTLIMNRALLNTLIRQQRFSGVSGEIALDPLGDVLVPVAAFQVPRGDSGNILPDERGYFIYDANTTYWDLVLISSFEWKGGVRPLDTKQRQIYQNSPHVRNAIVAVTVVCLAILLGVHGVLAWKRDSLVIKATSYLFTQLSLVGLTLITLSVLVRMFIHPVHRVVTTSDDAPAIVSEDGQLMNEDLSWQVLAKQVTMLEMWLINIGYYVLVGSLFLKTSRISRIFHMTKIGVVKGTNDIHLLIALAGLILLESAVLIGLTLGDPIVFKLKSYNDESDIWSLSRYHGDTSIAFPVIYIFRFVILLPTCVYTFRVRNLPAAFNEAVQITAAVYNLAFTSVLLPILESIVNPSTDSGLIAHSVVVWFITMSTAGILILPKLVTLYAITKQPIRPESEYRMTLEKTVEKSITPNTEKTRGGSPSPQPHLGQKGIGTVGANTQLNTNNLPTPIGLPRAGSVDMQSLPKFGLPQRHSIQTTPVVSELPSAPTTPVVRDIVPPLQESHSRIESISHSTGLTRHANMQQLLSAGAKGEVHATTAAAGVIHESYEGCVHPTIIPIVVTELSVHPPLSSPIMTKIIPIDGERPGPRRIRLHVGAYTNPAIVEAARLSLTTVESHNAN